MHTLQLSQSCQCPLLLPIWGSTLGRASQPHGPTADGSIAPCRLRLLGTRPGWRSALLRQPRLETQALYTARICVASCASPMVLDATRHIALAIVTSGVRGGAQGRRRAIGECGKRGDCCRSGGLGGSIGDTRI